MSRPPLLRRSFATRDMLARPRPRLRGLSHRIAAFAWPVVATWLVWSAPPGRGRIGAVAFGTCIWAMFVTSAVVHWRRWTEHATEILLRADHTAIFLAIAGTATPIALLGLHGTARTATLVAAWVAAGLGILVEWLPFATPRGMANTVYLTLGWGALLTLPMLWTDAGPAAVAWLLAGGVLYTVGAVIVGIRRPDPNPRVFGYHEVWHLLVIGAVSLHAVMIRVSLFPLAA